MDGYSWDEKEECTVCGCRSPVHAGWCTEIRELRELLERAANRLDGYAAITDSLAEEIRRKLKGK